MQTQTLPVIFKLKKRKSVFEHLSNVHCTDIDEVWPGFSNLSLVCPMKLSFTAQEEWTIGVINYAAVGNEFVLQIETYPSLHVRDQSPQLLFALLLELMSILSIFGDGMRLGFYSGTMYRGT